MKDDNFDNDSLNEQTMEETQEQSDDSNVQDSPGTSFQTSTSNEKDNLSLIPETLPVLPLKDIVVFPYMICLLYTSRCV